jgi:hypothetical protein
MTTPHAAAPQASRTPAPWKSAVRRDWILLAIAVAALVPRVYLGLTQFVSYDGYWHVFTATQDHWRNTVLEYKADAHPILYYILLRWVSHLGHFPIVYRSVSILPGAAAAYVVGKIAEKICTNKAVPILAAAAYAFAITSIDLSIDVRSYMGCLFFVLLSFHAFLTALLLPEDHSGGRAWIAFGVFASLAIGFEYYALFYLAACWGLLGAFLVFDSSYRRAFVPWAAMRLSSLAWAALIPLVTIAYFYRTHLRLQPKTFAHVASYYWDPASGQSRGEFLLKNLRTTLGFFVPAQVASRTLFLGIIFGLALLLAGFAFRQRDAGRRRRLWVVILMPVLLLTQLGALGLADRYPFGGEMRQQSIIAPFLCIGLFLLLDQLMSTLRSSKLRVLALVVTAIAIAGSAYSHWETYPRMRAELFSDDYRDFVAAVPAPDAVFLDQYSLIGYFGQTHDWRWRSSHVERFDEPFQEFFTTRSGKAPVDILRVRPVWNLDFTSPSTYTMIAQVMRDFRKPSISVFHLHQMQPALPPGSREQHLEQVQRLAGQAGLKVTALEVPRFDFFATFQPQ